MSFRKLVTEINELSEWMCASCRRHMRRWRPGERHVLQRRCMEFDPEKVMRRTIRSTRFIVMDTETTGFEAYAGDELVEIALLEYRGLRPTGRKFHTRIRPDCSIPESSSRIHGIRDEDVENEPGIDEVFGWLMHFIDGAVLVGHHVAFDIRFLNRVSQKLLDCRLPNPSIDTMVLYLAWSGQLDHYSLDDVAHACNVQIHDRHTALGDAQACGAIFRHIVSATLPPEATVAELMSIDKPPPEYGPDYLGAERSSDVASNQPNNN